MRPNDAHSSRHCICMVTDFFYPSMGGVETHVWCLSQCLLQLGHKVIVVTHGYGERQGIRCMTNGLKVYYLPLSIVYDQVIYPTFYGFFGLFRNILIREQVTIVHGHQSVSPLTNECLLYSRTMGYHVCYSDHSIFGFDDIASIHINKVLEILLSDVDHIICVSHTCRENLVLRGKIHPSYTSTIPNAVNSSKFTPDPSARSPRNTINIVMLSRLVYRKGIELAVRVIPQICEQCPSAYFIIGGDGPLRLLLEEMCEKYQLYDRMEILGAVEHENVRDVLCRGHIFLNCSLTESFCMALIEAASCGLFVVSTKVGGVPEVLPPSMIKFAEPSTEPLVMALIDSISIAKRIIPTEFHVKVSEMYNWNDIAERTVLVYDKIKADAKSVSLESRYLRYLTVGSWSGAAVCCLITCMHLLWCIWEVLSPVQEIEVCPSVCDLILSNNSQSARDKQSRSRTLHHNYVLKGTSDSAGEKGSPPALGGLIDHRSSSCNIQSVPSDQIRASSSQHRVNRQFLTPQPNTTSSSRRAYTRPVAKHSSQTVQNHQDTYIASNHTTEHRVGMSSTRGSHRTRELLQRK